MANPHRAGRTKGATLSAALAVVCGVATAECASGQITSAIQNPTDADAPVANPNQRTLTVIVSGTGSGTISSSPSGIGDCMGTCSAVFAIGTVVTLTATGTAGSTFTGWSGACSGTTCTVTMDADRSASAGFNLPASGFVPLTLLATSTATAIPVRSGIPFATGIVTSIDNLRLDSGDGTQQLAAQFDALSHWPDGSIKSALVQFVADVGPERSYRVSYGASVVRRPVTPAISASQAGGATTVDTGAIKFVVDSKGLVSSLSRDVDGNGSYDAGEQVLGAGDVFMVNSADGVEFTAARSASSTVDLEEQGPVRAVVRARGALTSATGAVLVKYLLRYYAYVGSDKLDVELTVIDDRAEADVENPGTTLALSARRYGLRWAYLADAAASYRFGLDGGNVASGTVSGESYVFQNGSFVFDDGSNRGNTFSYSGVGTGARAPGWVALDSGARHLALSVRDFWQQFPIELNVNGTTLTAALFSDRGITTPDTVYPTQGGGTVYKRPNSFYFLRPGGAKTHQLRFAFGNAQPSTSTVTALNDGYQRHRLELVAPPSWYTSSRVFGDIDVGTSPTASSGYDAMLLRDIYIPSIEATNPDRLDPTDLGGDANMYGWRDYGDRLRAGWNDVMNGVKIPSFYNDTHIGANIFLHEFVRTGEQRWFQLGEISTRHFADIDVAHGKRSGYWDHAYGMGQQPPGEIHAISHTNEDHQVRNQHWGHSHVSGMSDLYLLTGDKRSMDVLSEIAGWWKFVTPYFYRTPFTNDDYREAERDYAWPLYVMNEWVRVTGDADYHKNVNGQLVNYLIQWWQTPQNHIGYNPATDTISASAVVNVNDASKGTGYFTMFHMDNDSTGCTPKGPNSCPDGVNPWMAGPLLSSIITFYEEDKLMAAAGKGSGIPPAVIEDMLLQCMNYIVKYGWDAKQQFFVYSEVTRTYAGADQVIDYSLAYLDRLYRQRASTLPHPEWYDTRPLWSTIANKFYTQYRNVQVGTNVQSWGFYGYEAVTPVDFFKIMSGK